MLIQDLLQVARRDPMFYERLVYAIYSQIVSSGDVVIDMGAHLGLHTRPLSRIVGPTGVVYSVEALPYYAAHIRKWCLDNQVDWVHVAEFALSDVEGNAIFNHVRSTPGRSGILLRDLPVDTKPDIEFIRVQQRTLDTYWETLNQPKSVRFIKCDLEGGEFHALLGSRSVLSVDRPFVIFENGKQMSADLYGYTADGFFRYFEEIDYLLFDVFGQPLTTATWNPPKAPYDFIGVPRSSSHEEFVKNGLPKILDEVVKNPSKHADEICYAGSA